MPVLSVAVTDYCTNEQKRRLIEELTGVTNKLLAIPPDKIVVIINEVPPENWGQAGTVATDQDYTVLSRRTSL